MQIQGRQPDVPRWERRRWITTVWSSRSLGPAAEGLLLAQAEFGFAFGDLLRRLGFALAGALVHGLPGGGLAVW